MDWSIWPKKCCPMPKLPDEMEKRILEDARALATDLKPFVPEPGGSLSFSYLTPQGYEGFTYDWTQNLMLDDSKPLSLARHTGGSPLLACVGRSKTIAAGLRSAGEVDQKGLRILRGVWAAADERCRARKFKYVMDFAVPQLKRMDHATRTMLIPALADGQAGLVLDADITSKRWHNEMPPAVGSLADDRIGAGLRCERCGAIEERR